MKDTDWEILYELYQNKNITKVAALMYMTQPSITKRIKQIEAEFGAKVIDRTPHGIVFTETGTFLAGQAEKYIELKHETESGIRKLQSQNSCKIRIGSPYTYSKFELTDFFAEYLMQHPGVWMDVVNETSDNVLKMVLEGEADGGFVRGDYDVEVNRILVARDEGYLITKDPVAIEELPSLMKIGYKSNANTQRLLESWWRERFHADMPRCNCTGYMDFAWRLIAREGGYTLSFLPAEYKNEYNLCLTPLVREDGTLVVRNTWFVYPKEKIVNEEMKRFICYMQKYHRLK